MLFETLGYKNNPAILFFHAMGVTGASSERVARQLCDKYFCIMPTSTVYCAGQKYISKVDEVRQVEDFLYEQGVECLALVVASSIGADLAIKSLYWSNGGTLKKIMWCDDDEIKPYFIAAGKTLKYGNLYRQLSDSLENKPFPNLPKELQKKLYFEFGSKENHYQYRGALIKAYPYANYPVFEGYKHMQYQICNPQGFAKMLCSVAEKGSMPKLPFFRK